MNSTLHSSEEIQQKILNLNSLLRKLDKVIVLFSGGIDSSFLLHHCALTLPSSNLLAVIGVSPSLPQSELTAALTFSSNLNVKTEKIYSNELENIDYVANSGDRCFHCKVELNTSLEKFLIQNPQYQNWLIVDGLQASDNISNRPGVRAGEEFGIKHPLREALIFKEDIRNYFKSIGNEIHSKPQSACLSSRFMVGTTVSIERLKKVEAAESIISAHGFSNFRVRIHDLQTNHTEFGRNSELLARIEFSDLKSFWDFKNKNDIITELSQIGFSYITLDLTGYKEGGFSKSNLVNLKISHRETL